MSKTLVLVILAIILVCSLTFMSCTSPPSTLPSTPSTSAPTTKPAPATSAPSTMSVPPAAAGGVIKIGHIRPLTGDQAMVSPRMMKGFEFAFEQIGYQVAGKQIQIIVGDSKGDTATAIDVARKMVESDHVAMVVGPTITNEMLSVANYMNQAGIPHIITSQITMELIPNNKWTISTGGSSAQTPSSMATYAYDQLNYRKIDILTQDNGAGRSILGPFIDTWKRKGGQIVQEVYSTYPAPDFAPYLSSLKDADALVAWTSGGDAIKFLNQFVGLGIGKKLPLVGAFHGGFIVPFIFNALPPDVAQTASAYLCPTPYSPMIETDINKKFVADWKAKYNEIPGDDSISAPYQGALAVIQALKATNGDTTPDKLRQALLNVNYEGPQGQEKIDPQNQTAIVSVYIAKTVKQDNAWIYIPVFTYKDVPTKGF